MVIKTNRKAEIKRRNMERGCPDTRGRSDIQVYALLQGKLTVTYKVFGELSDKHSEKHSFNPKKEGKLCE